jgi:23S rRNA G2445 N2-methylase RlmL
LWSRIGVRILMEIASFDARDERALYEGTRQIGWAEWVTPRTTLAVRASCRSSRLTHSQFVAQKTKDAIVDVIRESAGARPSVDRDDPDVAVSLRLARDCATVYLDVGGASLHERGWRTRSGVAPLRETLAAAILRLSGWNREGRLVDPMCGGGTLAIEAAAWAHNMAPGLSRTRFGFERWACHDDDMRTRIRDMRERARNAVRADAPEIIASDVDPAALDMVRGNARDAGVDLVIRQGDVRHLEPLRQGTTIVTNPPYGERLDATADFYDDVAAALGRSKSERIAILAGTPAIGSAMGRPPDRWWILYNGPIECRLLVYESFGG